ncbi:hypothetical protein [Myroides sp. LJL119]
MKQFLFILILIISSTPRVVNAQNTDDFAEKIAQLMFLVSSVEPDQDKVEQLLGSMTSSKDNPMQIADMDYSIYPGFQGDKLYYTKYSSKQDDRFSVELLKKGDQKVYSIDFILNSSYSLQGDKVSYKDPSYALNCDLSQMQQLCTKAMKYSKAEANLPDTTVLSCVYVNPVSKKSLMYWVVLTNPIGDKTGNTIKEIKIQDTRLWQRN